MSSEPSSLSRSGHLPFGDKPHPLVGFFDLATSENIFRAYNLWLPMKLSSSSFAVGVTQVFGAPVQCLVAVGHGVEEPASPSRPSILEGFHYSLAALVGDTPTALTSVWFFPRYLFYLSAFLGPTPHFPSGSLSSTMYWAQRTQINTA